MRTKLLIAILVCGTLFSITFAAHGELSLESVLVGINYSARSDFSTFRTQISLNYNIPNTRVEYYYSTLRMAPADIYMVAELAYYSHVPVEQVVKVYRVHKHKGWGYIARVVGIKPGSREFMRLKGNAYNFHGKMKHKNKRNKYDRYDD